MSNILNHQIFQELFRKLFSKLLFEPASVETFATFVSRLRRTVFVIADAKVGIISKRANFFELFLSFLLKKTFFASLYLIIYTTIRRNRPHLPRTTGCHRPNPPIRTGDIFSEPSAKKVHNSECSAARKGVCRTYHTCADDRKKSRCASCCRKKIASRTALALRLCP